MVMHPEDMCDFTLHVMHLIYACHSLVRWFQYIVDLVLLDNTAFERLTKASRIASMAEPVDNVKISYI